MGAGRHAADRGARRRPTAHPSTAATGPQRGEAHRSTGRHRVRRDAGPGGVLLWVRDSGPGVPEEDVERIFERFQRARAARGTEGSGLGLSIVAGIAAAHDGRVALDQGGPGARFSLMLPLRVVSRTPGPTRRPGGRYLPAEPSVPYPDEWSHR
ncbi:sensor histidine kinase [Paractinoplanes durhamensis]|uniref:sensor histidine kinase n=1 Tax=Paractinoplanes durhamensis TaxID=113563 RepID=UPI0036414AA3